MLLPVCFAEPLSAFISVRRRKFRWKITLDKREVLLEMSVFYQVAEGFVVAHLRGRRGFLYSLSVEVLSFKFRSFCLF